LRCISKDGSERVKAAQGTQAPRADKVYDEASSGKRKVRGDAVKKPFHYIKDSAACHVERIQAQNTRGLNWGQDGHDEAAAGLKKEKNVKDHHNFFGTKT